MSELEIFCRSQALLGEGPVWLADREALAWVDIEGRQVHVTAADGASTRSYDVPDEVGAAVPRARGGLLLGIGAGFATLDLDDGSIAWVVERAPGADPAVVRMNDGDVDPQGRFWCGTKAHDETPAAGVLYRLDGPGQVTAMLVDVTISNGLVWSDDGAAVYYVDTPTQRIDRFAYDPATGTLGERRTLTDTSGLSGWPDGMTIDADGNLWVAFWGGWCVRCFSGDDGRLLEEHAGPVAQTSSCAFGGKDLRRLFVTSARTGLDAAALAEQPLAGSVFAFEPGVRGVPQRAAQI